MNKGFPLTFQYAMELTARHEGGAVNHKDDRGGKTNLGITQGLLDGAAVVNDGRTVGQVYGCTDVSELVADKAKEIYYGEFWLPLRADEVGDAVDGRGGEALPIVAAHYFDIGVNSGKGRAQRMLQAAINITNKKARLCKDVIEDGIVGKGTLRELAVLCSKTERGEPVNKRFYNSLLMARLAFYYDIIRGREANESFKPGWYARWRSYLNEGDMANWAPRPMP